MKICFPLKSSKMDVTRPFTNNHLGIDYRMRQGDPVHAVADGRVTFAVSDIKSHWKNEGELSTRDYGNFIKIDHNNGYSSLYAHLEYKSLMVKTGDTVVKNQIIGKAGNTGNSNGVHLHFEFRKKDECLDPNSFFEMKA